MDEGYGLWIEAEDMVFLSDMSNFYKLLNCLTGGTSIMKVKLKGKTPKLYYVHPTCFEAGKPMEFFVCGSNLLQSKFRYGCQCQALIKDLYMVIIVFYIFIFL